MGFTPNQQTQMLGGSLTHLGFSILETGRYNKLQFRTDLLTCTISRTLWIRVSVLLKSGVDSL